jgi:NAD(P)-dependent dehydrogenase (short-subunit alcohol dehydrogenase family)
MRLEGKVAMVIGAGQSPGKGIGNGRATVRIFITGVALPVDGGALVKVG